MEMSLRSTESKKSLNLLNKHFIITCIVTRQDGKDEKKH